MPHSSDDQPSAPTASVESETPSATVADAPEGANPAGPSLQNGETQQPRRRRRRRRRSPPAAASPGAAGGDQTTPEGTPLAGDTVQNTQVDAQGDTAGDAQPPKPRRHRRRRHGPPREMPQPSPVSADVPAGESGPPDPTTVTPGEDPTHAQPAPGVAGELRRPRRRRRRPAGRPGLTDRSPDARGQRDRRSGGRPPGRGRQAPLRKPEQKLYALESVVDRGFEDVTEVSEEAGSRRVHWTIIKRTVADQKSGKAMSASYVLQREGIEAEFPNLGAARAAVNKTIVHPEKLTLSKAEHVAAKGSR